MPSVYEVIAEKIVDALPAGAGEPSFVDSVTASGLACGDGRLSKRGERVP
jgi:hypothetical protein